MRLDVYLAEYGFTSSRSEAKGLIVGGAVTVGGIIITKPAYDVDEARSDIMVDTTKKQYASRGGYKLSSALDAFSIIVTGRSCLDIGASSGGFTDCLLQRGAEHVIAVDAGSGQMVNSLRIDPRVTVIENYNARYMSRCDFEYIPTLVVMDVSFISATHIIPAVSMCVDCGAEFVLLIKPQFEVGKSGVGKGGIVKSERLRQEAIARVIECARVCGFIDNGLIESPIKGGDGNVEYLVHLIKE